MKSIERIRRPEGEATVATPGRQRRFRAGLAPAAAALALLLSGGAFAQTHATLQTRESINYFYYFGGFAISSDEGEDGAPAPVPGGAWEGTLLTGWDQPSLAIAGSDHLDIAYISWSGFLDETWDQAQSFSSVQGTLGAELAISGHATVSQTSEVCSAITGCNPATEVQRSTNTLALTFSLDDSAPYLLEGVTSGGEYIDLLKWDALGQRWSPIVNGPFRTKDVSFSITGTLVAGDYMLRTDPYTFSAGGATDVVNRWDAQLTLMGVTLLPAVPEPASGVLAALGLGVFGLARRRFAAARTA